jgi:DoxX-like family
MNAKRKIAGNILVFLGGLMLLGSAGAKLAHVPKVVSQLGAMGFDGNKLTFIALLEVVSGLLFLIPLTRSAGLLLVSAFLGGAIATHLQHDQPIIQPSFVLLLIWLGTWLRHPGMLWSSGSVARGMSETANTAIRTSEI